MTAWPRVSVIVPAHNAAGTIKETLDSVRQQSFGAFECIVIDDGSGDATYEIAKSFAIDDDRFFAVHRERRAGVSAARNLGIALARSELIAFLDADDVCRADRLDRQVDFLDRHPDIGLVGSDVSVFGHGVPVNTNVHFRKRHEDIVPGLLLTLEFLLSSVMVRRCVIDLVGGFAEDMQMAEDWEFVARVARSFRCENLPDPLVAYRRSPGQATNKIVDSPVSPSVRPRLDLIRWIGVQDENVDIEAHIAMSPSHWPVTRAVPPDAYSTDRMRRWAQTILRANARTRRMDQDSLSMTLEHAIEGAGRHAPAF